MTLAHFTTRPPSLVQAIESLALRADHGDAAEILLHELAGITVLVARKFTNDRTAAGLQEAYYLTIGCTSIGISLADLPHDAESELAHLLDAGAEQLFQAGFRHIRELACLPAQTLVSDLDSEPYIQQRNLKMLFSELCRADPNEVWTGDHRYSKALQARKENLSVIECAKWLRKRHCAGPVRQTEIDAGAVIDIALMFAILNEGRIVARTGQGDIERLIRRARETPPDIDTGWNSLLDEVPAEFHALLRERMEKLRGTLIKKILSRTAVKSVVVHIQRDFAGDEQEVDYD